METKLKRKPGRPRKYLPVDETIFEEDEEQLKRRRAVQRYKETHPEEWKAYQREYQGDDAPRPVYVREKTEFWQKFEKEPNRCCVCGTTYNLHSDGRYGYRCNSLECIPY